MPVYGIHDKEPKLPVKNKVRVVIAGSTGSLSRVAGICLQGEGKLEQTINLSQSLGRGYQERALRS